MKSKLFLVSFLLLLYIGPMIFIASYASLGILVEPLGKGVRIEEIEDLNSTRTYIPSAGENWLSGWTYRQQHIVNKSDGAGENYTISITADGGSGSSTGDTAYLDGKMQPDFDDVRFTNASGVDLLNYWREEVTVAEELEHFYGDAKTSEFYMNNDPCAIYDPYSDTTYIAMHGPDYDPYVTFYNHTTDEWAGVYKAGTNPLASDDAHGSPSMWINTTGYIHILFGCHGELGNNRIEHRVTENAYDISSWMDMTDVGIDELPTYPLVYYEDINNVVHLIYRSRTGAASPDNDYQYQNSTDNGNTWSAYQVLVDVDGSPDKEHVYPCYGELDRNNPEIIHVPFRIYNESDGKSNRIFYSYLNTTTGILYNVTGASLGTTITEDELLDVTAYGQIGNNQNWAYSFVHVDDNSNPYLTVGNYSSTTTNLTICFLYWNDTAPSWSAPEAIYGTPAYSERAQHDFFFHSLTNITLFMPVGKNMTKFVWDGDTWTLDTWIRNSTTRLLGPGMTTQYWNGSYNNEMMVVYSEWLVDVADAKAYAWGIDGNVNRTYSGYADFWVRIANSLTDADQTIYVYYGNPEASYVGNGTDTFLFYEDWSSQSTDAWTQWSDDTGGSVTYSATDATQGGYVAEFVSGDGEFNDEYRTTTETTAPYSLMFRAKLELTTADYHGMRIGTGVPTEFAFSYIESSSTTYYRFVVYDSVGTSDIQDMDSAHWGAYHTWEITRPKDGSDTILYIDDVFDETGNMAVDNVENPYATIGTTDADKSLYSDWFAGRKYIVAEPAHDTWGAEDAAPMWYESGEAELLFTVPIDETGLDMLLIFLGLIMIPLSTLYLVKGGRSEMSSDKLFYGLIAFAIGWALFLGGIT